MLNQEFVDIDGYDGHYQIGSLGCVISKKCGKSKVLKPADKKGYERVSLIMNGKVKVFSVHRLVAFAFIKNPENKTEVNHINGIKNDNRVCNLEWCTSKENAIHRRDVLGYRPSLDVRRKMSESHIGKKHTAESIKKMSDSHKGKIFTLKHRENLSKKVYCIKTLKVWNSTKSCAEELGLKHNTLSHRLNGKLRNNTSLRYLE